MTQFRSKGRGKKKRVYPISKLTAISSRPCEHRLRHKRIYEFDDTDLVPIKNGGFVSRRPEYRGVVFFKVQPHAILARPGSGGTIRGSTTISLKESLAKHKGVPPIIVDRRENILDGEHRSQAAYELGLKFVPAVYLDQLPGYESAMAAPVIWKGA